MIKFLHLLNTNDSYFLIFEIPLKILISIGISFLIWDPRQAPMLCTAVLCVSDDGSIPFLDSLITPNQDGSLQTKVYRNPTHTNLYLKWDSHHAISNKFSVIGSLLHRAKNICSSQELLKQEQKQIQHALTLCKYPMWAINRMKTKTSAPRNNRNNNLNNRPTCRNSITVPYNEGLSEAFKNICKRYGIEVHFKSGKTIKDKLVAPKDKDHITKKVV